MFGILPFFHAFGYSATLWLALALDMAAVFHFDAFGTSTISELAKKYRATPVEGYGTTELAPWATVNVPAGRSLAQCILENKLGTVGRPVPGIQLKVVDPDTRLELPIGQDGLLLVRGPNVMLGYLNLPEKTAMVIQAGWYDTGDIVKLDTDGFVTITGRVPATDTAFSKPSRTTFVGSMIPASTRSTYFPVAAFRPIFPVEPRFPLILLPKPPLPHQFSASHQQPSRPICNCCGLKSSRSKPFPCDWLQDAKTTLRIPQQRGARHLNRVSD